LALMAGEGLSPRILPLIMCGLALRESLTVLNRLVWLAEG